MWDSDTVVDFTRNIVIIYEVHVAINIIIIILYRNWY